MRRQSARTAKTSEEHTFRSCALQGCCSSGRWQNLQREQDASRRHARRALKSHISSSSSSSTTASNLLPTHTGVLGCVSSSVIVSDNGCVTCDLVSKDCTSSFSNGTEYTKQHFMYQWVKAWTDISSAIFFAFTKSTTKTYLRSDYWEREKIFVFDTHTSVHARCCSLMGGYFCSTCQDPSEHGSIVFCWKI